MKELINDFERCLQIFEDRNRFTKKQYDLHKKVIAKHRAKNLGKLLEDNDFLELVYDTVKAWAERGGKLVDAGDFKNIIRDSNIKSDLLKMQIRSLEELDDKLKNDLKSLFTKLANSEIKSSKSQIVVVSKTIHHLLPDLVPPIDRAYILEFFGYSNHQSNVHEKNELRKKEEEMFCTILDGFYHICEKLHLKKECLESLPASDWNTSIPKTIDNAIIGLELSKDKNKKHKKQKYRPLEEYLKKSSKNAETLSFGDIEKILEFELPKSAYEHRAWWANTKTHSHARAWLNSGWQVDDVGKKFVKFKRIRATRIPG